MNRFLELAKVEYPVVCGAMYPCSNPELVAAVTEAGGLGILQPLTLTYVCGYPLREGIHRVRTLTQKPVGMNLLIEKSSKLYENRMREYLEIALEEGIRFFVTALGNPKWVVEKVHAHGGVVFHDVTSRKWADKAAEAGVDGFICVNNLAGGHAGTLSPEALLQEIQPLSKPMLCAGGVGDPQTFRRMLDLGYDAVQMGTRFIATTECHASPEYKQAILTARATDVALTERLTGVPVSVIVTPKIKALGLHAGPIGKFLLRHRRTKHWMRLWYSIRSFRDLRRSILQPSAYADTWQAGKSVEGIESIASAGSIVQAFGRAARESPK